MADTIQIQAASMAQVRQGRKRRLTVTDDVGSVVRQIQEIDPRLGVIWDDDGEFFAVVEQDGPKQRVVLTALELDHRVLARIRELASPDYDYLAEIDRIDREADKASDERFEKETGEIGEYLAYCVRKDIQAQNRIYLPRGLDDAA